MNSSTRVLHTAPFAILAIAFAGCSGGGGGTSIPFSATLGSTTVSGSVAKGIVKQAQVLACRIVNGTPEPDANCASGITGNDGSYTITMTDGYSGPVMVKVMATAASTMMDETTGLDIPYNMTLRAIAPSVSGSSTVHVTPFSEMAASGAMLSGPMDATKISQAIAAVQNAMTSLGIDLSVMPMVDLQRDGADAAKLSVESNMAKQLSRVAMAAKNSALLKDAGGAPCNAGTTVSQQIACAVSAMDSVMTSYVSTDPGKLTSMMSALNQNVTNVTLPVRKPDGTVSLQSVDMSSLASMQSAIQNAGMGAGAASTAGMMMAGMR